MKSQAMICAAAWRILAIWAIAQGMMKTEANGEAGMNAANMAEVTAEERSVAGAAPRDERRLHLVAEGRLLATLAGQIPHGIHAIEREQLDTTALARDVAAGDSMIWIGPGDGMPREFWLGSFATTSGPLTIAPAAGSPLGLPDVAFRPAVVESGWIRPTKEMPMHNRDEEPRADLLPLLEARDRFGRVIGWPGVLMTHWAPSLVARRFAGAECFAFFFDDPVAALPPGEWGRLLGAIQQRFAAGLTLGRIGTDYASYQAGERARVQIEVANRRQRAAAVELRVAVRGPGEKEYRPVARIRRCPEAGEKAEATWDFPLAGRAGLWTTRVEAWADPARAEEPALVGDPVLIDRREIGLVAFEGPVQTARIIEVDGPALTIEGRRDFWVGTHYYPSSSWWDWAWRDFHPLKVDEDFGAIRRAGYRIVRVWVDPVLDEAALRAMDAAIWLAARHGIVLDVCIFTQWAGKIGFQRPGGELVEFDYAQPDELNLYSISLRNLALQREYAALPAGRWRGAGNLIYNLSNEAYIHDPDAGQMDAEAAAWEETQLARGETRDSLLFRRWAREISSAMRGAGCSQPIMPGYLFSTIKGGDTGLANRDADIVPWHCYHTPETCGLTLTYFDPAATGRPIVLEEFGQQGWNNPTHYDGVAHYALAAGGAAAMSYEWGVRWLAPEHGYHPLPLRSAAAAAKDPRSFAAARQLAEVWPTDTVGLCPTPSGFGFGSIYHGTPFPAAAATALGRLGRMGAGLGRVLHAERAYLIVPKGNCAEMEAALGQIGALWREKIAFGVWPEELLMALPAEARVLLIPQTLSMAGSADVLSRFQQRGGEVFEKGATGWERSPHLERLVVHADEATSALARRTEDGRLWMIAGPTTRTLAAEVTTPGAGRVELGIDRFSLIREQAGKITLLEAAGAVKINGEACFEPVGGRILIASADGRDLRDATRVRLISAGATALKTTRRIARAAVLEEEEAGPIAEFVPEDPHDLRIDAELRDSVLELTLE